MTRPQADLPQRRAKGRQSSERQGVHRTGAYETEQFYTHRLSLLGRLLSRTTKRMLGEPFGLTQMEWRIIVQLEHSSPARIAEIHQRSLCPKPQISSSLPALIRKGYVVREQNHADARAPYFAITDEGLRLYRAVMRSSRKRQRALEALLTGDVKSHFEMALDRLIDFLVDEEAGEFFAGTAPEEDLEAE